MSPNSEGQKYMVLTHNKTKKKKQGNESASKLSASSESRALIMEQPGSVRCPILSFETFLSHLNGNCTALFQEVRHGINPKFEKFDIMQHP